MFVKHPVCTRLFPWITAFNHHEKSVKYVIALRLSLIGFYEPILSKKNT